VSGRAGAGADSDGAGTDQPRERKRVRFEEFDDDGFEDLLRRQEVSVMQHIMHGGQGIVSTQPLHMMCISSSSCHANAGNTVSLQSGLSQPGTPGGSWQGPLCRQAWWLGARTGTACAHTTQQLVLWQLCTALSISRACSSSVVLSPLPCMIVDRLGLC